MSENGNNSFDDEFEFDPDGGDLVGQLRKALKAQRKATKDRDDELATLRSEVGTLKGQVTAGNIKTLLEAKGAKPALAKFMDGVEATDEAVTAWLTENGDFFGYKPGGSGDGKEEAPAGNEAPGLDPEMVAALAAMQKVQQQEANAAPGPIGNDSVADEFLKRVGQNATSFEDVEKALRDSGMLNNNN